MNHKYSPIFQPYTLNNGIEIKNRLVIAPLTHYASNPDGSLSQEELDFIDCRGNNFGIFIAAATLVSLEGKAFVGQPEAIGNKDLSSLEKVASSIKSKGAKAILQIHHGGKLALHDLTEGLNIVSPSENTTLKSRMLRTQEISNIIAAFGNATDLALQAGFDGVEIHGANGYLIQQFYSAQSNLRVDEWGGSTENRLRFILEIIKSVHQIKLKHERDDFIIGYRFSPEEPGENGLTMEDTLVLVDHLVNQPLQYLHISLHDFYKKVRRGADTTLHRIQLIHSRIKGKLPLIGIGNLYTADDILNAYRTGWADFIAVGRSIMVNPDLATLILTDKENEINQAIDPERNDFYKIPSYLWHQNMQKMSYLPPVKDDDNWKNVDI